MLKTFLTLMRGAAAEAEQAVVDRNALAILKQQIREAAAAIERSKQALAIAIAQGEADQRRLEATLARIADLEERAAAALEAGADELAEEAAETIAMMEIERDAIREARAAQSAEIGRLRLAQTNASRRLAELERGKRIAEAAEAVNRLKAAGRSPGVSGAAALAEAESTLRRLRERQSEQNAVDTALESLDAETSQTDIANRLEAAGFGKRTRSSANEVLERLRRRNAESAPAPITGN